MLEAFRGENVLDIVLSSQKESVHNVKICEPLGCSDHNQIYFSVKVKRERNRKIQEKFTQRKTLSKDRLEEHTEG